VLAASPKPVGEGWRFVKPKLRSGVIDGAIALAMAVSIAGDIGEPPEAMLAFTWQPCSRHAPNVQEPPR
jgi:hypothetical protein